MEYRIKQPVITDDNPFANCKLGREPYATILTQIVEQGQRGSVLSLNGAWGTGKTTFVKMWERMLQNKGFPTLYYNAWESDFVSDPFVALIGELSKALPSGDLCNNILPFLKSLALRTSSSYINNVSGGLLDAAVTSVKDSFQTFHEEIENYNSAKKSLVDFRQALQRIVEPIGQGKPLVFIVDELDRCNPHFAVKVLERIKHLFTIDGIVFVLSIDKDQLCSSIRGYYGSDRIDAEEYLRRFIDIEYNLPEPDPELYLKYLIKELKLADILMGDPEKHISLCDMKANIELFQNVVLYLVQYQHLSLRQQEKLLILSQLTLQTRTAFKRLNGGILALLAYLTLFENKLYTALVKETYTLQELCTELETCLRDCFIDKTEIPKTFANSLYYAFVELLYFYADRHQHGNQIFYADKESHKLNFTVKYMNTELLQRVTTTMFGNTIQMQTLDEYIKSIGLTASLV